MSDGSKVAFETSPDRGYTIRATYIENSQDALVELFKDGAKVRETMYPAYRVWNVYAHARECIDAEFVPAESLAPPVREPEPETLSIEEFQRKCPVMYKFWRHYDRPLNTDKVWLEFAAMWANKQSAEVERLREALRKVRGMSTFVPDSQYYDTALEQSARQLIEIGSVAADALKES